jgi:hypothetical protein
MDIAGTNELIGKALANGLGHGRFEVVSIERLDAHLHGHAFKYHQDSGNIVGVYSYRIAYRDGDGGVRQVDVMVKAKPDQKSILAVYQGLLASCGITLRRPLADYLENSDYSTPNLKEAVLFRDFRSELDPYLPESLGVHIDEAASYTLRLERILPSGSVILDPDDDTTRQWRSGFSELTLRGIADIHGRFLDRCQALLDTGYFTVCDTEVMMRGRDLWQAFYDFLGRDCPDLMIEDLERRHRHILDTLPQWYGRVDRRPKTLLYGDVNPQNLAFAKTADGFQLSVFDWERAVIGLPQRDLAEHLVYTLPDGFGEAEAMEQIDIYLDAFSRHHSGRVDRQSFLDGLALMLNDLIVNRLPLMMIVNNVAHKRRHAGEAYARAHRLLALFE